MTIEAYPVKTEIIFYSAFEPSPKDGEPAIILIQNNTDSNIPSYVIEFKDGISFGAKHNEVKPLQKVA